MPSVSLMVSKRSKSWEMRSISLINGATLTVLWGKILTNSTRDCWPSPFWSIRLPNKLSMPRVEKKEISCWRKSTNGRTGSTTSLTRPKIGPAKLLAKLPKSIFTLSKETSGAWGSSKVPSLKLKPSQSTFKFSRKLGSAELPLALVTSCKPRLALASSSEENSSLNWKLRRSSLRVRRLSSSGAAWVRICPSLPS